MELAAAAGFGTGIVTTSSVTDATPASFVAHVNWRLCEGPAQHGSATQSELAFSRRSLLRRSESERRQGLDRRADRGFGSRHRARRRRCSNFAQPAEGEATKTVAEVAADNGFRVIDTADELATLAPGGKVLGLFAPSTMPVQWRGDR